MAPGITLETLSARIDAIEGLLRDLVVQLTGKSGMEQNTKRNASSVFTTQGQLLSDAERSVFQFPKIILRMRTGGKLSFHVQREAQQRPIGNLLLPLGCYNCVNLIGTFRFCKRSR